MMPTGQTRQRVALGTFELRDQADAAVSALRRARFADSEIGFLSARCGDRDHSLDLHESSEVDENVATGAIAGATAGAGIGGLWAVGVAAGMVPAIGPFVAVGLGGALASAAAGAAAGGVGGALFGLGLSGEDSDRHHDEVSAGRTVVTVRAGNRYPEAVSILLDHGAAVSSEALTTAEYASDRTDRHTLSRDSTA